MARYRVQNLPGSRLPAARTKRNVAIALGCFGLCLQSANAQTSRVPAIVTVCAPCHGADGAGGDVEKPNLAGQKSIYIRRQLEAFRAGRRKHPEMRPMARELTNREIDQLVIYYSTLAPR
jgi:cytochrome c553